MRNKLPKVNLLFVAGLLCAVAALVHSVLAQAGGAGGGKSPAGGPRILVSESTFDFGVRSQGDTVEHSFKIQNTGGQPLEIRAVQPACGCSAGVAEEPLLAPGASSTVNVSFNTAGFRGYKVKTFRVFTNDPAEPTLVLSLKGTVRTEVDVSPGRLYFGTLSKADLRSARARLSAKILIDPKSNAKVQDILSRSENVKVSYSPTQPESFSVSLEPGLAVGVFRSRVVVKTSSSKMPVINVPVYARIEGDLRLMPADVSFGLREAPLVQPLVQKVRLVNRGTRPIKILSLSSDRPEVQAQSAVVEDGRTYEITVSVEPGVSGALKARVEIKTDHPDADQRTISFPVFAIVSPRSE